MQDGTKKMKIELLCNDGSPLGVSEKSIFGDDGRMGVGGAELALLTLCKGWHDLGYDVTLYNSPDVPDGSCFKQKKVEEFQPFDSRDVLIIFRSPNERIRDGANGLKVWWSCDQKTLGDFKKFSGTVDKIVTISPHHSQYFKDMYGIFDTVPIDLPVRIWEYDLEIEKIPYRCIWNSMPDRGAMELAQVWGMVVEQVPEASLVLTSDWRLWSPRVGENLLHPYRAAFARLKNVSYMGAVNRRELIIQELQSQVHLNVNKYEELFCIALAETQVAGAYPISSTVGAMRTTNLGKAIEGSPVDMDWRNSCVEYTVELLQDQKRLKRKARKVQHEALNRFSLEKILKKWEDRIFK